MNCYPPIPFTLAPSRVCRYLHAVVDTYGSYAFGFLPVSKQPEAAVAVLLGEGLPCYRRLKLSQS